MLQLPPEIWARIASLIRRDDLRELTLVSSFHRDIARRELDKEIVLEPPRRGQLKTMKFVKLLIRDGRAINVRSLSLMDNNILDHHHQLDKVIRSFPNLRVLFLDELGSTATIQRTLLNVIQTRCPHLERFALSSEFYAASRHFPLPNLTRVQWNESGANHFQVSISAKAPTDTISHGLKGKISAAFLSLCRASLTTLRDVQIIMSDRTKRISRYVEFFSLRFPALEALQLGPGPPHLFLFKRKEAADTLASVFAEFLIAHPTITYLRLLHGGYYYKPRHIPDSYIPFSLQKSSTEATNILPNLVRLRAHPNQVAAFADAGAQFFRTTLRSLYIAAAADLQELSPEINNMFHSLLEHTTEHGPSHTVQELTFTDVFQPHVNLLDNYVPLVQKVASIFPSLKLWKGPVPKNCDASDLAQLFSPLSCLRTLAIQTSTNSEIRELSDIAVIAAECPFLEEVICDRPNHGSVYHIGRTTPGKVEIREQNMDPQDDMYHSGDESVDPEADDDSDSDLSSDEEEEENTGIDDD